MTPDDLQEQLRKSPYDPHLDGDEDGLGAARGFSSGCLIMIILLIGGMGLVYAVMQIANMTPYT